MLKRVLPFSITLIIGAMLGSAPDLVDLKRSNKAVVSSTAQRGGHSRTWVVIRSLPGTSYTGRYSGDTRLLVSRLRVLLGADGTVQKIEPLLILSGSSPEQVINAAKNIKFTPATRDGEPISVWAVVEYGVRPGRRPELCLCPSIVDAHSETGEPWRVIHE